MSDRSCCCGCTKATTGGRGITEGVILAVVFALVGVTGIDWDGCYASIGWRCARVGGSCRGVGG